MKKHCKYLILVVMILFPASFVQAKQTLFLSANNAVLMESDTKTILFEKKAHERQSVASITKIMTAILAIEHGDFEDTVKVSERAIRVEGSSVYLLENEEISLGDLVYGLMLRSGNDASIAISEHIGGSVEGFIYLMNEKAKWLGMTNTNFENPHGLESDNHYSTAYDIALLLNYAINNELFQKVSGTTSYLSSNRTYKWYNKNKLLTSLYEYCTGGKTGFTKKAGRTLATTAKKNNQTLIAVTLNAPDDWRDHIRMFNWGFEQGSPRSVIYRNTDKDYLLREENFTKILFKQFKNLIGMIHND